MGDRDGYIILTSPCAHALRSMHMHYMSNAALIVYVLIFAFFKGNSATFCADNPYKTDVNINEIFVF